MPVKGGSNEHSPRGVARSGPSSVFTLLIIRSSRFWRGNGERGYVAVQGAVVALVGFFETGGTHRVRLVRLLSVVALEEEVDDVFMLGHRNGKCERLHRPRNASVSTCSGRESERPCFQEEGRRSDLQAKNKAYDEIALERGNVKGGSSFVVLLGSLRVTYITLPDQRRTVVEQFLHLNVTRRKYVDSVIVAIANGRKQLTQQSLH